MKKLLAMLLAMMMLIPSVAALADDELDLIELNYTSIITPTIVEDPEDAATNVRKRAMITLLLLMDYCAHTGDNLTNYDVETSCVGYDPESGMFSVIYAAKNGTTLVLALMPHNDIASYLSMPASYDEVIKLDTIRALNVLPNDVDELRYVTEELIRILSEE